MSDENATYRPSTTSGEAARRWRESSGHEPWQQALKASVQRALDQRLHYTRDVLAFVVADIGVSEEALARDSAKVEGGAVGMDVYYARKQLEAEARERREAQLRAALALRPGEQIGKIMAGDHKQILGCEVLEVSDKGVKLRGTRGPHKVEADATYTGIYQGAEQAGNKRLLARAEGSD